MPKSPKRAHQVSDLIQQALVKLIQREISDPRLAEMSVVAVEVTPDLGTAKIYYSVLNEENKKDVEKALQKASGFLRRRLSDETALRYTPQLRFIFDDTLARAARISELVRDVPDENDEESPEENS